MKRDIVFRGKDVVTGEWYYGDLEFSRYIGRAHIHTYNEDGIYCRHVEVYPDSVGQFTGLHDKNGKDIYEGDIVRWEYKDHDAYTGWCGIQKRICKVVFEYGSFRIDAYPYHLGSCEDFYEEPETYGLEIMGNVYDNPELLESKSEIKK